MGINKPIVIGIVPSLIANVGVNPTHLATINADNPLVNPRSVLHNDARLKVIEHGNLLSSDMQVGLDPIDGP
jgi:hypothetical protein